MYEGCVINVRLGCWDVTYLPCCCSAGVLNSHFQWCWIFTFCDVEVPFVMLNRHFPWCWIFYFSRGPPDHLDHRKCTISFKVDLAIIIISMWYIQLYDTYSHISSIFSQWCGHLWFFSFLFRQGNIDDENVFVLIFPIHERAITTEWKLTWKYITSLPPVILLLVIT